MNVEGGSVSITDPLSPERPLEKHAGPEKGIGLCLSGGGYRAMLFHVGALWRLNDAGLLPKLDRISSVSGGSITAGCLGVYWKNLAFDAQGVGVRFEDEVVKRIRGLAYRTIDASAVLGGALLPGTISDRIVSAYGKHLFGQTTLQDLPDTPRFVINATNVQSGALWRFSKPYMADYRVGMIENPCTPMAVAVAASSAFPPILSPVELDLDPSTFKHGTGTNLTAESFRSAVVLSDGGVYDNLGLETVWKRYKTILVSDAGAAFSPEPDPKRDWGRHAIRVLEIIDNQVRSLRKRQLIAALKDKEDEHDGAYWGIATDISNYPVIDSLPCERSRCLELAATPTRLKHLDEERQQRLINWGYAVCDAALRAHVDKNLPAPKSFPYNDRGV